jgi:iron complex transport system ATP-binding protein
MLKVENLSVSFGSKQIVKDVSFEVERGHWLMVVGPNGAGKTTIVNAVSQGVPYSGTVTFEGVDVKALKSRALARCIGVLSQKHYVGYGFTTEEVIRLGRYSHRPGLFEGGKDESERLVHDAIEMTGTEPLLKQSVLTLSGGELQRAFLAQLFAQAPQMLLLDEPTNHLDLIYQKQVFSLVRKWIDRTGGAVLSVVHDLSLAKAYGTEALLLREGAVVLQGSIAEVMTPRALEDVYGMDVYAWMREMYGQWV